jgi:dCMP deaminase
VTGKYPTVRTIGNNDPVSKPIDTSSEREASERADVFHDADSLLAFVTKNWLERWVTTDIGEETTLEAFSRRPFFLLISVDAPVMVRWKRFQEK